MQRKRSVVTVTALVTFVAAAVFDFSSGRGAGSTRELRASEVMGHPGVAVDRAATGPTEDRRGMGRGHIFSTGPGGIWFNRSL